MSTARTPLETANNRRTTSQGEARISPRSTVWIDGTAPSPKRPKTPAQDFAHKALVRMHGVRKDIEDIFTGLDLKQNTDQWKNIVARAKNCCCVHLACAYYACHTATRSAAAWSRVGFLMDQPNRYLFAQPGMHNINSMFIRRGRGTLETVAGSHQARQSHDSSGGSREHRICL